MTRGIGPALLLVHVRLELGRGAFAGVFLAEEANLAGRPVVLKISSAEGDEPQLASLRYPVLVKPNDEGSSKGIRDNPICRVRLRRSAPSMEMILASAASISSLTIT